ncbi:MAG: hypothetical protein F6K09_04065 [Merismopedia sp. SIO2A8]|nr:hypothetical protein [Merismopedia sp. SIO2A8]
MGLGGFPTALKFSDPPQLQVVKIIVANSYLLDRAYRGVPTINTPANTRINVLKDNTTTADRGL